MPAELPPRLIPLRQACRYAMMGTTRIYKLIGEGRISAWKRGGRTFIDLDTIDAYNAEEFVPIAPKPRESAATGQRQDYNGQPAGCFRGR
jgi:hypothetical protein